MPGPAQKHPSRRNRRNTANVITLPAEGWEGEVPTWPLAPDIAASTELEVLRDKSANLSAELASTEDGRKKGRITRQIEQLDITIAISESRIEQAADLELDLWEVLWRDPQAAMWSKSAAFTRAVAQWVRWNIRAEQGDLKAAVEARLRGAELGLTPRSLLALRREIAETEASEDRASERRQRRTSERKNRAGGDDDPRNLLAG